MLRPKLGRIWGSQTSVARRDPGDAKYATGWLSEIPTYQVLNYLQWKSDATFQALAERGVFEWGSDVAYKKNAAAWDESAGQIYVALLNNPNTTLKPSSNLSQWAPSAIQISRSSYDAAVQAISNHIADVTGNPHKLTPARLGTYTTAQIDALVAQYKALVYAHTSDTNNPHKLTAAQVGAVPVTGGTYSGNVTMSTGQVLLSTNGASKVVADSSGTYVASSAGQVGVGSDGKGFVKIGSGAKSEIVTQDTFAANKALVENSYISPLPIFYMPMMNDINIYQGGGYVTMNPVDASFDSSGRCTMPNGTSSASTKITCSNPIFPVLTPSVTLAVDVSITKVNSNVVEWCTIGVGTNLIGNNTDGRIHIGIRGDGWLRVQNSDYRINYVYPLADLQIHRIVVRKTPQDMQLYVDGILVSSVVGVNKSIGPNAVDIYVASYSSETDFGGNMCNFRVWDSALTPNQISAL